MCYMFGLMVGSTAFGYLADRIGRKKALFIGIIMSGTSFLVQSFLKNFWAYSIMQIVTGFAAKGVFMIAFVICMEMTGTQYSTALGILVEVSYLPHFFFINRITLRLNLCNPKSRYYYLYVVN